MVRVKWIDSAMLHGWQTKGSSEAPVTCVSVGFLVEKTRKKVVVALSKSSDGGLCDFMAIPRVAVRSIKRLR